VNLTVNIRGVDDLINQLNSYSNSLQRRTGELCRKLAEMGAVNISLGFSRAIYTGQMDANVTVEEVSPTEYKIVAEGQTVLFVEFGAGVTYGGGHPQAAEFGFGPGTYPGQTHAMTGNGWYLPKDKGGGHTYGNPPNMPMYNTAQDLKREIERVAREVLSA